MYRLHQKKINSNESLIRYLLRRQTSGYYFIIGKRESGKTNLALVITEVAAEDNTFKFYGANLKIGHSPVPIEKITDLETLIRWCKANKGKKLFIIDEAGKNFSKREWYNKLHIQLINNLQILRKYQLTLILITPDLSWTDKELSKEYLLDGVFKKYTKQYQKNAVYIDLYEGLPNIRLNNIPKTTIEYDTFDDAPFTAKPEIPTAVFQDKQLKLLWQWCNGATYKELGIHNMQLSRLLRKFVKDAIENLPTQLNNIESEVKAAQTSVS